MSEGLDRAARDMAAAMGGPYAMTPEWGDEEYWRGRLTALIGEMKERNPIPELEG
jgi:hypothetical protein